MDVRVQLADAMTDLQLPDHDERVRRMKVAMEWGGLKRAGAASLLGMSLKTLDLRMAPHRGGDGDPPSFTIDELLTLGRAVDVPDSFMLYGFPAMKFAVALSLFLESVLPELPEQPERAMVGARSGGDGERG